MRTRLLLTVTLAAGCAFDAGPNGSGGRVDAKRQVPVTDARTDARVDAAPDAPPSCNDFELTYSGNNNLYHDPDQTAEFAAAADYCKLRGGYLAIPDDNGEFDAIFFQIDGGTVRPWVGVKRGSAGWVDVLGEPASAYIYTLLRDSLSHNCLTMYDDGVRFFRDSQCEGSLEREFLCECER